MDKGWSGIGPNKGKFVAERDSFDVAASAVGIVAMDASAPDYVEFREALVDWFFSGQWVYTDG